MPPSKPASDTAEVGRKRILDAAASLFASRGYQAVSLRMIADAADMKAGSIYYHFASKEVILTEILDAGIRAVHDEVRDRLAALPADASASDVFRAMLRGHLCALLEHGAYTSANVRIFGQVPPAVRNASLPIRQRYEALLDGVLADLQDRGAIRPDLKLPQFRLLLIGALNATLEWFDPRKSTAVELADNYADTFMRGAFIQRGGKE